MKVALRVATWCMFLVAMNAFAIQQDDAKGAEQAQAHVHHMTTALKLTADQQTRIAAILSAEHRQHLALAKESISQEDKMARAHAMHAATHKQIRALLNVSQKRQFDRMVHGKGNGPATAAHVKQLSARLSLTPEQQTKLKGILEQQHQQHMALSRDTSLAKADKMSKAASLHEATEVKIRDMLTDNQKRKFDQMKHPQKGGNGKG